MVRKSEVVNYAKFYIVRGLSEEDFCTFSPHPFPQFRKELVNRHVIGTRNIHSNLEHVRIEADL